MNRVMVISQKIRRSLFGPVPFAMLAISLAGMVSAQNQAVQSYPLSGQVRYLDGQWEGIKYASDGNVYFASSSQSAHHGASFFKYSPATQQVTMLAEDITTICGEDPQTNPQGKIHADIQEMHGWLFFTTHFGADDRPGGITGWTGGHLIGCSRQAAAGARRPSLRQRSSTGRVMTMTAGWGWS